MIKATYSFDPAAVLKQTTDVAFKNLQKATVYLHTEIIKALNKTKKLTKGKRVVYVAAPRGGPPHKRTGWGQAHVAYEFDRANLVTRVGLLPNARYMAFLELKSHPWLDFTLKRVWDRVKALAEGK